MFTAGRPAIVVFVERHSRFLIARKLPQLGSACLAKVSNKALRAVHKDKRRTLTLDNGTEFADHLMMERKTNMDIYFADPRSPWQRPSVENTNGLIRQYFPKGTDFRDISHPEVRRVENLLNNRPRACLGFRTPAEVFFERNPPAGCD